MKSFDQLAHLGRGRRLRPHVAKLLLDRFELRATQIQQVAESINVVFRVHVAGGERYVIRLTPPTHFHDLADVRSEVLWLRALADEGIGVPVPVAARTGDFVVSVSWPEIPGTWHCVLFEWIQGANLADRWTERNIERFGRLVAQLHVSGRRFEPPEGFLVRPANTVLPHCNPAFARPEPRVLFDGLPAKLVTPSRRTLFEKAHELAEGEIQRLFSVGDPMPIHNDLHAWNVMVSRDRIYAIDFENMLMGFPVQDIGTLINYFQNYVKDEAPLAERLAAFRQGYESCAEWPEAYPGQIRLMTASHRLLLCNYYASHHDLEFREFAYKVFGVVEERLAEDLAALDP